MMYQVMIQNIKDREEWVPVTVPSSYAETVRAYDQAVKRAPNHNFKIREVRDPREDRRS